MQANATRDQERTKRYQKRTRAADQKETKRYQKRPRKPRETKRQRKETKNGTRKGETLKKRDRQKRQTKEPKQEKNKQKGQRTKRQTGRTMHEQQDRPARLISNARTFAKQLQCLHAICHEFREGLSANAQELPCALDLHLHLILEQRPIIDKSKALSIPASSKGVFIVKHSRTKGSKQIS